MLKEKGDPLAEFSGINPKKIIGSKKASKESSLNFISGGSPIGSSVLSGAKNNIVGFDRAKISPKKNNLGSFISTLTTNIFNNTNSVSNIFGDKKEKSEKGFKPFGGFFDKVKEAIGFISFFGSKKNLDKIKENIDNLKTTFTETFDVAKALRKAILKIIEQLSGFSGGGGGGGIIGAIMSALGGLVGGLVGGLIPGMGGKRPPNVAGPTMKQEGNLLSKMPKGLQGGGGIGKLLLGGAAALGTGAAISGLSQPGDEEVQPVDTAPEVPGNLLDKFNSILDRFDKALDGLRGGKGKKGSDSSAKSSGSSGGGGSPTPLGPGPGPNPNLMGGPGIEGLASFVAGAETGGRFDAYNADSGKGDPKILDTNISNLRSYISKYPNSSGAVGAYQFMPETAEGLAKQMGIDPTKTKFTPEVQKQLHLFHLNQLGYGKYVKGEMTKEQFGAAIAQQYRAVPDPRTGYTWSDNASRRNRAQVTNEQYLNALEQSKQGAVSGAPPAPVLPQTPIKPGQQAPQTPTKPGQQAPQVSLVNVGSGTPQASPSRPSSTTTPPSPTGGNGPTAPFLPSYNPDNFLTLYSRMVYNIVG
jgi:hypothetical protein